MLDHSPKELRGVSAGQNLRLAAVLDASRTKLVLSGELDLASAPTLLETVSIAARAPDALTIDLSRLSFIDSSGVHALLRARDTCASHETPMWLVPGPRTVQRVFALTGSTTSLSWATSASDELLGKLSRAMAGA
jgi:anti-sigma B factor antagonist